MKHSHPVPVIIDHILHNVVDEVERSNSPVHFILEDSSSTGTRRVDYKYFKSLHDELLNKLENSDRFNKQEQSDLFNDLEQSDLFNFGTTRFDSSLLFEFSQSFDDKPSGSKQHWTTLNSCVVDVGCADCSRKSSSSIESGDDDEDVEPVVVGSARISALKENAAKLDQILDQYNLDELTEIEKLEDPIKESEAFRSSTPLDTVDPWPIAAFTTTPNKHYDYARTDTGLLDLDLIYPCTTPNPCLLDSMIIDEYLLAIKSLMSKKKDRFGFSSNFPNNLNTTQAF
jgi:hypothetical protein